VAQDYAAGAVACGDEAAATARLRALYERQPDADLLAALLRLAPDAPARLALLRTHLQAHPTLSGAAALLKASTAQGAPLTAQDLERLQDAAAAAARPMQRYRCAACGFEAQHFFWQCPGCQNWDSYPPRRLEDT
jgi:lipopolysaccharide biosynthesis regulator YciM